MLNTIKPMIDAMAIGETITYFNGFTGEMYKDMQPQDQYHLATYFKRLQDTNAYEFKQELQHRLPNTLGIYKYKVRRKK